MVFNLSNLKISLIRHGQEKLSRIKKGFGYYIIGFSSKGCSKDSIISVFPYFMTYIRENNPPLYSLTMDGRF